MSVGIGGGYSGDPTPDVIFPQTMAVDYVRVEALEPDTGAWGEISRYYGYG